MNSARLMSKLLLGLAVLAVLVYIILSTTTSLLSVSFTPSNNFSNDNLITVDSSGDIKLVPSNKIDSSINNSVKSLENSTTTSLNNVYTKNEIYNTGQADQKFQPKSAMGNYIKYNSKFYLQNTEDGTTGPVGTGRALFGRYSDRGGWYNYSDRVAQAKQIGWFARNVLP